MSGFAALEALLRPELERVAEYVPGRQIARVQAERGIGEVFKLASNENCLGPSPRAVAALERAAREVHRYPDTEALELRRRLAERHGLPIEWVHVGAGSSEILLGLARCLLGPGLQGVHGAGSFVLYPIAVHAAGGTPVAVKLRGYDLDLPAMAEACGRDTRLLFVANPNNPTGTYAGRPDLEAMLEQARLPTVVVLDEAYAEYVGAPDYPEGRRYLDRGNVVCLRTFSKVHGLAGLRVGYALAPPPLVLALRRLKPPFSVSGPSQAAALAALEDEEHVRRSIEHNRAELAYLFAELERSGLEAPRPVGNFFLLRVGGDEVEAAQQLEALGVITRPVAAYGLPGHLRVTVGTRAENQRLLAALDRWRRDA